MNLKKTITFLFMIGSILSFGQHPTDSTGTDTSGGSHENQVNLFAANAFTPDGDSFNETWKVYMEGIDIYDFHLVVFNRYGEIVWESFDVTGSWDGNYGGNAATEGIYSWFIETRDAVTDKKYRYTGTLFLLR